MENFYGLFQSSILVLLEFKGHVFKKYFVLQEVVIRLHLYSSLRYICDIVILQNVILHETAEIHTYQLHLKSKTSVTERGSVSFCGWWTF